MPQPKPKPETPPPPRLGPRPLPLHLMTQLAMLTSSRTGLTSLSNGSFASNPALKERAANLAAALEGVDRDEFAKVLNDQAIARSRQFVDGVMAYRRHPWRRDLPDMPEVWREGTTRLVDYRASDSTGAPVLVIPSLINRAYILDLTWEKSALRRLAAAGLQPYLVDWDRPGEQERGWGLEEYVGGRLVRALDRVTEIAGRPPLVLGYCMGGTLAMALAVLRPEQVAGLVLLAAPWDFHAPDDSQARMVATMQAPLEDTIKLWGELPVDVLQALFATIDMGGVERKFRAFAGMTGPRARDFVALEDWLNDGVPLAGPVAREALFDWYRDNKPGRGAWVVGGQAIRPEAYPGPTHLLVPMKDRIVPPASALALVPHLARPEVREVEAGHIGMVSGATSMRDVVGPLARRMVRMAGA